ncbi:MAG: diphthine--ammonia ligase [Candidatus Micrarchaeota archaeon]
MKIAALYSGGKDSTYATYWAIEQGHEVVWLNMRPQEDSMMFHHPNLEWCKLQAQAAGIKLHTFDTTHETELEDLKEALRTLECEGLVTGAVQSVYQKSRIDKIANDLELEAFSPIWHKPPEFLKHMLEIMDVRIVSVSAQGLGEEWLSKRFMPEDVDTFAKLDPPINVFLEGGEGETFACDAPFFKKRIEVKKWDISWNGNTGKALIKEAALAGK